MKMKRAQMKMTETIAILFIFFILLVVGVSFFVRFQKAGFDRSKIKSADLRAIETAQRVASLPELQCSTKDIVTEACFDLLKLGYFDGLVTSGVVADNQKLVEQYHDLFGFSEIEVKRIYSVIGSPPDFDFNEKNTKRIYNNPGEGTYLTSLIPILMIDVTTNRNIFGVLNVTFYPRGKLG
jgi:hypothetical protein